MQAANDNVKGWPRTIAEAEGFLGRLGMLRPPLPPIPRREAAEFELELRRPDFVMLPIKRGLDL